MSIAKMSTLHNSYRYFTVSIDGYQERCVSGIIYHAGQKPGILFNNFLEMVLHMNNIFDEMSCPKQSMETRTFSGTRIPRPAVREYREKRAGTIATFRIYVKFRYNASWQGELTWLEGKTERNFESFLQMMQMINQILSGCPGQIPGGMSTDICQIAIDSCAGGLIKGSVQNAPLNYIRRFYGTVDLAETMGNLFDTGIRKLSGPGECREEIKVITKETWNAYRRGGKKGTFLIKVLFREHSTWQGIIYWRDTGEKQMFRSFMEMMLLMASTTEVDQIEQIEPKSDMIRKSG